MLKSSKLKNLSSCAEVFIREVVGLFGETLSEDERMIYLSKEITTTSLEVEVAINLGWCEGEESNLSMLVFGHTSYPHKL